MRPNYDVMDRWVAWHEGHEDRPYTTQQPSVHVHPVDWNKLNSFGSWYTLAEAVYEEGESRENGDRPLMYVLNGDQGQWGTSGHQWGIRRALTAFETRGFTEIAREFVTPILSFEALRAGRIDVQTIRVVEVLEDRLDHVQRSSAKLSDMPKWSRQWWDGAQTVDKKPDADGLYHWEESEHFLGATVFHADYTDDQGERQHAYFLSAFDQLEPIRNRPYFLAQLPRPVVDYNDALESLKPMEVLKADAMAGELEPGWTRQGDIFAIPTLLTTRELKKIPGALWGSRTGMPYEYRWGGYDAHPLEKLALSFWHQRRTETMERSRVLGTDHVATHTITLPDGTTYARGTLRHDPRGRRPDHVMKRLGDMKTWHLIVQNNAAKSHSGAIRAWSSYGRAD